MVRTLQEILAPLLLQLLISFLISWQARANYKILAYPDLLNSSGPSRSSRFESDLDRKTGAHRLSVEQRRAGSPLFCSILGLFQEFLVSGTVLVNVKDFTGSVDNNNQMEGVGQLSFTFGVWGNVYSRVADPSKRRVWI